MNILIVDDQRVMREIVKTVVSQLGHWPLEADSGEEALELVSQQKIDMLLLDVEMPGINGFETARAIRQQTPHWFPIVFLSAKTETEFFVAGIQSGGDAYLYKPVVPDVLAAMIRAMERIVNSQEELHRAKVKMEKLAHRDALTGAVNRRGFDNAIQLEFEKAKADKQPLAMMMIDVDHFKLFNDNYGHQAGDDCLRQLASQLESALCREQDILARYGGEEFAVILPETDIAGAKLVAERLEKAVAKLAIPHEFSSCADRVTMSIGLVLLGGHASAAEFIEAADQKLYQAKTAGRNRVV